MTLQLLLFLILAIVAIASALGMLISRNAIYSALFLVMNFMTIAIFFLLLDAPFIAVAQVSVYTGAIMVLFLFVIMLLGAERAAGQTQAIQWQRPLAVALAIILLLEAAYILLGQRGITPLVTGQLPQDFGSPSLVGSNLFSNYLLPFEITSVLLLVAMIGAIVLTKIEKKKWREIMLPINYYLGLAIILFIIGALGVLVRRNAIVIFMSVELMLNAANLAFVAYARYWHAMSGQIFVFFIMTVAAAEVAIGLALIVTIFRTKDSIDVDQINTLKG